jgi:hypothetical protein
MSPLLDATSDRALEALERERDVRPVEQDWPFFLSLLPADWETLAHTTGAFQRKRGVPDASAFLRLIFAYAYCGLSLRLTVFWAALKGIADLSEVALLKRLRRARPWLGQLLAAKLAQNARLPGRWPPGLRIRLVDATSASRPGSTGTDWRVHLGFQLATLTVDQVELTSAQGGETFKRLPGQAQEITIGDRGYSQRQGIAALAAQGSWVIVRLNWNTVPLQHPDGRPFDLFAALDSLPAAEAGEWAVHTAPAEDGTPAVAGRWVAVRKSPAATEAARRKVRQEARRKGKTPTARSLEAAAYVVVFTTVPGTVLAGPEILELYRFRWQIELAFKRMKSLLELDTLPAKDPELCQTFLLTKLLAALLVDELTHRWVDFSPWGYGCPAPALALAGVSGGSRHLAPDDRPGPRGSRVAARDGADPWLTGYAPPPSQSGGAGTELTPL